MQVNFGPLERAVKVWLDEIDTSMVKPKLHKAFNGYWTLQLVDVDDESWSMANIPSNRLDRAVEWTTEQLESWDNCRRMAWDMWDFKFKHDAEKFITLFHLSWPQ